MSISTVKVQVDSDLLEQATKLYNNLGLDINAAFCIFLKRSVLANGIPFAMTLPPYAFKAERGARALHSLAEASRKNGTSSMTLEEINAEIDAVREEMRARELL